MGTSKENLFFDFQPEQWEEYQKTKQRVSSDSEDEEDEEKDGSKTEKKGDKDGAKLRKTKPELMIELDDDDLPLAKAKDLLAR